MSNECMVIGNAAADGKMSENGSWYEVTVCDSPPNEKDGSKNKRYVTRYLRCSLFVKEGETPPVIKKGQRCVAIGQEYRRDWTDTKNPESKKSGVELEMKCAVLRPMGGKLAEWAAEGHDQPKVGDGDDRPAQTPVKKPAPGKAKAKF